ncbi:hypothetical protein KAR91_65675 [Candidatus Pacearchaeota archaeon]|nr:hypothetical protein [Candidatus Pacearchaeota archaeon]
MVKRVKQFFPLIMAILLVVLLGIAVMATDYGDFAIPRDTGGILPQDATFIGCKVKLISGVAATEVKDGPGLVYGVCLLGDAAGEFIKVVDSDTISDATSILQIEQPDAYGRTQMFNPPIRCYDVIYATTTDSSAIGFVYYR